MIRNGNSHKAHNFKKLQILSTVVYKLYKYIRQHLCVDFCLMELQKPCTYFAVPSMVWKDNLIHDRDDTAPALLSIKDK